MHIKPLVLAVLLLAVAAETPEPVTKLSGVSARPLTATLACTYFIARVDPTGNYEIDLAVFLVGAKQWTDRQTEWNFHTGPEAFSEFKFDGSLLRIDLNLESRTVKVLDYAAPLSEANVLVISGMDTADYAVSFHQTLNLVVPFESDPMLEVVKQSESLQKALGFD